MDSDILLLNLCGPIDSPSNPPWTTYRGLYLYRLAADNRVERYGFEAIHRFRDGLRSQPWYQPIAFHSNVNSNSDFRSLHHCGMSLAELRCLSPWKAKKMVSRSGFFGSIILSDLFSLQRKLVRRENFEISTRGLRDHCSASELTAQKWW